MSKKIGVSQSAIFYALKRLDTSYKKNDVSKATQDTGYTLEFLPQYSPDLNPIEKKWTQAKSIRQNMIIILMSFLYANL